MLQQIMHPKNTPHYQSHANQMDVKNHPDWGNGSGLCITTHPHKRMDHINMHRHHGQPCPPMPPLKFQNNTHHGKVHYSERIGN